MKFGFWINFLSILAVVAILMRPMPLTEKTIDDREIQAKLIKWQMEDLFQLKKIQEEPQIKQGIKAPPQIYLLNREGEVYCLEKKGETGMWLEELLEKS